MMWHFQPVVISIQHHRLAKLFLLDHRLKPSSPVTAEEREAVRVRWLTPDLRGPPLHTY